MTEFIMLVGLPASGKTTYAQKLNKQGFRIHSSDAIREELTGDINLQDRNTDMFNELRKRVKGDLQNEISCVHDATNMSMKRRKAFLDEIKKYDCRKTCILFIVPVEVCKERNSIRERKVPDSVFDKMLKQFQCPYYYEGWDNIKIKWYDKEFDFNYPYQIDENYNIIPFDQKNPNHKLSLEEHMSKTHEYLYHRLSWEMDDMDMGNWNSIMDAGAAHDIGKYYTQTFVDYKGEKTDIAHYYGHENYGSYIYLVINNELISKAKGVLYDREHIDPILLRAAVLINWHMRPHTAWKQSEKSRKRDKELIGEEMYQDIMLLHEADLAAH